MNFCATGVRVDFVCSLISVYTELTVSTIITSSHFLLEQCGGGHPPALPRDCDGRSIQVAREHKWMIFWGDGREFRSGRNLSAGPFVILWRTIFWYGTSSLWLPLPH